MEATDKHAPATNAVETTEDVTAVSKGGSTWVLSHRSANRIADDKFYSLGYWVATHAKLTLLINVVFITVCSMGFVNFNIETDGEFLWAPRNSLSKQQETIIHSHFHEGSEYALVLVESATKGGNVLTKEAVDVIWELDARVMALETQVGNTYADLCTTESDGVTCKQPFRGITRFWGNCVETYEASVTSDADVRTAINVDFYPDGQEVSLEAVFGNAMAYDAFGGVSTVHAFMQSYELRVSHNDDAEYKEVRKWQALFHVLISEVKDGTGDFAPGTDALSFEYYTGRSLDDALKESVSGERLLFVATYTIMIAFVTISLSRCGAGSVGKRTWLGSAGVMVVLASGVAAYGFNSALGVPFTTLSQILPFILIGIGVDDMFVMASSFDHTSPTLPVEERVALALKRCGVSITYTSMTNFFAFMLGSSTSLPAVEYFCLYAGTAILFDFLMQITAFSAFLTMDANRQLAGRLDCCCCIKDNDYREVEEEAFKRAVDLPSEAANKGRDGPQDDAHPKPELTRMGRFMKEKYTPCLLSATGKTVVLLGSAAVFAAGVYGATQATQGFEVTDLAPDGHHVKSYKDLAREYELEIDTLYIPISVFTREVDYADVGVQAQIRSTDELMLTQRFVVGPLTSWLASFLEWTANAKEYSANLRTEGGYTVYGERETFYTALADFTDDADNVRFATDLVYNEDGVIEISRSDMYLIDLTSTENAIQALKDARAVIGQSTLDPQPMAFSPLFIFSEQFLVIYDELISNYTLALLAVAVLSMFVLGQLRVVALVCFTVVIIDVELLGFVYYWGLEINTITVIEMVMAVGLVVDYMVHIVHYILHQDSNMDKNVRIAGALGEVGPSVVVGATTTLLGIMPMAFASNHIFRVFFKMFLIIISFGFFHGIAFIPVVLSLLPERSKTGHTTAQDGTTEKGTPAARDRQHVVPEG